MTRAWLCAAVVAIGPAAALAQKAPTCGTYPAGEAEVVCLCAGGAQDGAVWGSNPYTADSDICTAAVHAGVLGPDGGPVLARREPGLEAYPGTVSHGVTSSDWGAYPDAFSFVGAQASGALPRCRPLAEGETEEVCACPPLAEESGPVWGSGPYTTDSHYCTAAVHAGVIGAEGGPITVVAAPGQEAYPASAANGVTTTDWGSYGTSVEIWP